MRTVVVAPPDPVVTWEEADKHLKLNGDTSQKEEVEAMIAAATATIDGPSGWLGRAIGRQTLETRIDAFERCGVELFYPPVVSVESVIYLDVANAETTLDEAAYELMGSRLVAIEGASWPATLGRREAVRITYLAGYDELPKPIRSAILLMTEDLYRFRGTVVQTASVAVPMSVPVSQLLQPFRVYC